MILNVLLGCEHSGIGREAFRALGHNAWSCDLLPALDKSPYHYQGDVRNILNRQWHLAIFFPPCTYLLNSGVRWLTQIPKNPKQHILYGPARVQAQNEAADFFMMLWAAPIKHVAIENPTGIMSSRFRKPDQRIQPYQFGHPEQKETCLWLRNLPPLTETVNMYRYMMECCDVSERENPLHERKGRKRFVAFGCSLFIV